MLTIKDGVIMIYDKTWDEAYEAMKQGHEVLKEIFDYKYSIINNKLNIYDGNGWIIARLTVSEAMSCKWAILPKPALWSKAITGIINNYLNPSSDGYKSFEVEVLSSRRIPAVNSYLRGFYDAWKYLKGPED